MKKMNIKLAMLALLGAMVMSCKQDVLVPEQPKTVTPEPPSKGTADFTTYVSIGNSLTAGYQAGALFDYGQQNSFPKMLSIEFAKVGGGVFNQPDINSPYGFFTGGTNPISVGGQPVYLGRLLLQGTPPAPSPTISAATSAPSPLNPAFEYAGDTTKLNNFGVPGIIVASILYPQTGDWSQYGSNPLFNPFYARFSSKPGTSTILSDAIRKQPTFFTFELGNNDILGYAVSGGSGAVAITDQTTFATAYNTAIGALLAKTNAKGVVSTIPDVTTIPYFFTVPWNPIPFTTSTEDAAKLSQLNGLAGYGGFNAALDGLAQAGAISQAEANKRKVSFSVGSNGFVIVDETLADLSAALGSINAALAPLGQVRQTNSNDLVTLSAGSYLGANLGTESSPVINGVSVPLINTTSDATKSLKGDDLVLIPSETTAILTATAGFNSTITAAAAGSNGRIAVADVNSAFKTFVTTQFSVSNGVMITPSIAPPFGGFSEDGIHPNTRGYAFLANIFIDAINSKFGSTLYHVDLSIYPGTALPINP